jgi:hypothetical protein
MPCEKYQDALTDLAARGAEVVGVVREHLNVCASCGSYLEQERFLLESIDSGIRSDVNAALPAAVVQRLQARLAQESAFERRVLGRRIIAGAGAALVAAALALLIARPVGRFRSHAKLEPTFAASVKRSEPAEGSSISAAVTNPRALIAIAKTTRQNSPEALPAISSRNSHEPEVLVPSDEREALARFVNGLHGQPEIAEAFLPHAPRQSEPSFPLPLIQIARLEIPALEPSDDRNYPASEK